MEITNEFMMSMLGKSRQYTVLILRMTDKYDRTASRDSEQGRTIWQHGKRNFELRESGKLALVGPLLEPPYAGLGVFATDRAEAEAIMRGDPAIQAGLFSMEFVPWRAFPGDALPPMDPPAV